MNCFNYKSVTFKELIKFFLDKIVFLLLFSIIGFGFAIFYINSILVSEYSATGTIIINRSINIEIQNTLAELTISDRVITSTVNAMKDENITMLDKIELDESLLKKKLEVFFLTNSPTLEVMFTSRTKLLNDKIVNILIDNTINEGNLHYPIFNNSLMPGKYAEGSYYTGASKSLTFGIIVTLTFITGVNVVFFYHIFKGRILFVSEFSMLKLPYSKFNKNHDYSNFIHMAKLYNKVESSFPAQKIKVIGFISTEKDKNVDLTIKEYSAYFSNRNLQTLVIDFDSAITGLDKLIIGSYTSLENNDSENITDPVLLNEKNNINVFRLNKYNLTGRVYKDDKTMCLISELSNDCDHTLIKISPSTADDTFLIPLKYLDVLIITVRLNYTKRTDFFQLLSKLNYHKYENVFINFVEL